jgi:glucosamine--fructose-6-phosphate aminotransferase (isomerizing)
VADRLGGKTFEEINEQGMVLDAVLRLMDDQQTVIDECTEGVDTVVFTGCGSSYYMALAADVHYRGITGRSSTSCPASEILLYPDAIFETRKSYLLVVLSRSGATTEVLRAVEVARDRGIPCLAIGCYEDSPVSKIAAFNLTIAEAAEESVCTTKSFSGMLFAAQKFACMKARDTKRLGELRQVAASAATNLNRWGEFMAEVARRDELQQFVFLGSGPLYGIACEGKMKLKEMALVPSDAFHSLEYRHGPKSVATEEFLITQFVSSSGASVEKVLLEELKGFGASTLVVCDTADDELRRQADFLVELGMPLDDFCKSVAYIPFVQLLAYHKADSRGIDTDTPRHLHHFVDLD